MASSSSDAQRGNNTKRPNPVVQALVDMSDADLREELYQFLVAANLCIYQHGIIRTDKETMLRYSHLSYLRGVRQGLRGGVVEGRRQIVDLWKPEVQRLRERVGHQPEDYADLIFAMAFHAATEEIHQKGDPRMGDAELYVRTLRPEHMQHPENTLDRDMVLLGEDFRREQNKGKDPEAATTPARPIHRSEIPPRLAPIDVDSPMWDVASEARRRAIERSLQRAAVFQRADEDMLLDELEGAEKKLEECRAQLERAQAELFVTKNELRYAVHYGGKHDTEPPSRVEQEQEQEQPQQRDAQTSTPAPCPASAPAPAPAEPAAQPAPADTSAGTKLTVTFLTRLRNDLFQLAKWHDAHQGRVRIRDIFSIVLGVDNHLSILGHKFGPYVPQVPAAYKRDDDGHDEEGESGEEEEEEDEDVTSHNSAGSRNGFVSVDVDS